jgi:hypothetical protein
MNIHDVIEISGLTRGQINQLLSRSGVFVFGPVLPGKIRIFTGADTLKFAESGELSRLGFDAPAIAKIWHCIRGRALAVDPYSFAPLEIFPGEKSVDGDDVFLLIVKDQSQHFGFSVDYKTSDELGEAIPKLDANAVVIPLRSILRKIKSKMVSLSDGYKEEASA